MKNNLSLIALAAGLSQVMATGSFLQAPKFSCPDNTDNICLPDFAGGLDWLDLPLGGFDAYKGFKWSGFKCADKFGKRDELAPRTFPDKCITGTAHQDKSSCPKISCDKSKGNTKTSIKTFQVTPKFDCDLEFHYNMPDGSLCKHRSPCKASGTTVQNTQCGGATDVTIVYPKQPNKPDTCDFGIHHIGFDCSAPKPPKTPQPPKLPQPPKQSGTSSYVVSTSSSAPVSSGVVSTSSYVASSPSASSPVDTSSSASSPVDTSSSAAVSSPSASASTPSFPINGTSSTAAVGTTSAPSVSVTSYLTTSTVFSTSTQTITSCADTVTNCPAHSTVLTTVVVPVSTTVCPVTETIGASTSGNSPAQSTPAASGTKTKSVGPHKSHPAGPVETLPCPGVVPSCLNTWMFTVPCKDNTDSSCYCPEAEYVKNIFTCLYAHGETDQIISDAISYFQGICAPFVPTNPGIATGAETITSVITATPTSYPNAVTTIEVATTVVVPCTNDAGETIPSSSSTVTISTSMTVPGVVFTTVTSGPSSTGVAVVPGTYTPSGPAAAPTMPAATATTAPAGGAAPYPTTGASTLITAPAGTGAAGTGGVVPSAPAATSSIPVAGAAHVGAGMGLVGFAGMVFAALL
ncbi:hypothetical protein GGR52DRAFT_544668 [Hypoxylon sp. FL1284]|nr:hypothetical protein GGR52DRAFT_544668 [Hypoxylon sp. FL1284]